MFCTFLFSISEQYLAFDIGSQLLKAAIGQESGEVSPYKLGSKNSMPMAFAFKTKANPKNHLDLNSTNITSFKIGSPALKYLRSKPNSGVKFLLNTIERTRNEFTTTNYATGFEMLSFYFNQLFTKIPKPSAITLVHPAYYTNQQTLAIQNAIRLTGVNLGGFYDDESVMTIYYADLMLDRFRNKPHHVLFIDIGATSTSCYSINFTWNDDTTMGYETGYGWSEKVGTYYFAKALSESVRIPISDAQELLLQSPEGDFAQQVLSELEKLLRDVLHQSSSLIDEIQLIGGGSRFQFVVDAITRITKDQVATHVIHNYADDEKNSKQKKKKNENDKNTENKENTENKDEDDGYKRIGLNDDDLKLNIGTETPKATNETNTTSENSNDSENSSDSENSKEERAPNIYKDFDPEMALALGCMHTFLHINNLSIYYPAYITKRVRYSMYIRVGETREKICQKNSLCRVVTLQSKGAERLTVEVDNGSQPIGTSNIFSSYKLLNISNMTYPDKIAYGRVELRNLEPRVNAINWCNKDNCFPIEIEDKTPEESILNEFNFVNNFNQKKAKDERRNYLLKGIKKTFPKINKSLNGEQIDRERDISDEEKQKFKEIYEKFKDNSYQQMSIEQLEDLVNVSQPIRQALGIKW